MKMTRWLPLALGALLLTPNIASAAKPAGVPTVELKLADDEVEGRLIQKSSQKAWLYDKSGQLREVELKAVKSFRQTSPKFSPITPQKLGSELLREFGRDFEIATTRHYVVLAPKGRAKAYVEVFDEVYRTFHMHFSVRGFDIDEPEFPLVALVFPNQEQFAGYAGHEGVKVSKGLAGYYMPTTNRVAVFEQPDHRQTSLDGLNASQNLFDPQNVPLRDLLVSGPAFGALQGSIKDTMIHEATHQVAFNVGLHDRLGENPKWVVEGLATVFEAPGIRQSSKANQIVNRVNPERLAWFKKFAKERRNKDSLEDYVSYDQLFELSPLDAYAEAWALSFFLIETRPRQYADYLHQMANRKSFKKLQPEERWETFQKTFGDNSKMLESEYLRFYEKLK